MLWFQLHNVIDVSLGFASVKLVTNGVVLCLTYTYRTPMLRGNLAAYVALPPPSPFC